MQNSENAYNELLDKLYSTLPEKEKMGSGERFEIPTANAITEGTKTNIENYEEICKTLRRKPEELAKFLFKELAIPGKIQQGKLVLSGKIALRLINEKITLYAESQVICRECKKPDTRIESHGRGAKTLVCEACGAKFPIRE